MKTIAIESPFLVGDIVYDIVADADSKFSLWDWEA